MPSYQDAHDCLQQASAWGCWWAGFQIGQQPVLWWSITAWARLGKVLQFVAGAFILIEVAGPARLASWSRRIAEWPTPFRKGSISLKKIGGAAWAFVKAIPKIAILLSLVLLPFGLILLLLGYWGVIALPQLPPAATLLPGDWLMSMVLPVLVLAVLAVIAALAGYSIVIGAVTKLVEWVSSGLAYLTGHPQLQTRAKLASWVIFVMGFALDFLAS